MSEEYFKNNNYHGRCKLYDYNSRLTYDNYFINNKKYSVKFSNIPDIRHIGHNYRQSEYNKFLYSNNKKHVKMILVIKNGTYGSISPLMIEFGSFFI